MARFNTVKTVPARPVHAIRTVSANAVTHEGGPGFVNDAKGEVFRLGVNLFAGGEKTFYESGKARDTRFGDLAGQLAISDPEWTLDFLMWLRQEGNIRTASILGAMYAIHSRLEAGATGPQETNSFGGRMQHNRLFAAAIPQRLDEVPEMFAIWQALGFGKFPQALKRGAGDALKRLANEYSVMKYDTDSHAWRVADVLSIAHVIPDSPAQAQLFKMALSNRYGSSYETNLLEKVEANKVLRSRAAKNPKVLLNSAALKKAGMTWEDALSLAGNKVPKAELWEALILGGSIGYMAMLRNLRNFQEAGISREATKYVQNRLADPEAVARSRQFPFRFWTAYKNATGTQWAESLETALTLSTGNVPVFDGDTLAIIDTSASMGPGYSAHGTVSLAENAALFAAAVALRNPENVDLHIYASTHAPVSFRKGDSLLRLINNIAGRIGEVGHGTETAKTVRDLYSNHNRVMVFTDMQSFGGRGSTSDYVKPGTWVYHWDLGGYKHGDIPSGTGRTHQLSGLTDATMRSIPLLERGAVSKWPWLV